MAAVLFATYAPLEVHVYRDPRPIPFAESWSYELRFPRDPRGPRIARVTLRAVLACHGLGELAERAEVLASELVTNAVRHTTSGASVRLNWLHPALRVSVWDASPDLPRLPGNGDSTGIGAVPPTDAVGGRGLFLLDVLADRWGGGCADGSGHWGAGGKTLWFELLFGGGETTAAAAVAAA